MLYNLPLWSNLKASITLFNFAVLSRSLDFLSRYGTEYEFLIIARIARDHLAIPATSAGSKCVFSVSGDIVTKNRNRLNAGNTRRLLCLQDWGVLKDGVDDNSDNEIDLDEADSWE